MKHAAESLAEELARIGRSAPRFAWDTYELHRPQFSRADLEKAQEQMRARCAAKAAAQLRTYKGARQIRDAILSMPLTSDGSELTQTERDELDRILGRQ